MSFERSSIALAIAALALAAALARVRPRGARGLGALVLAGLVGLVAWRWIRAEHPPVFGKFEMDVAEAAVLLLTAPWVAARIGRSYLRAPSVAAALTLAHSFAVDNAVVPLTISELSLWIDLHAPLAYLTWALYIHATVLAFGEVHETWALRFLGLAFVAQTAMGFVGAYYGSVLFGAAWQWDPVQTFGLLSWVLTAVALHLRLFFQASLYRQRYFVAGLLALYVLSAKVLIHLPRGASFHVFELGSMAATP